MRVDDDGNPCPPIWFTVDVMRLTEVSVFFVVVVVVMLETTDQRRGKFHHCCVITLMVVGCRCAPPSTFGSSPQYDPLTRSFMCISTYKLCFFPHFSERLLVLIA